MPPIVGNRQSKVELRLSPSFWHDAEGHDRLLKGVYPPHSCKGKTLLMVGNMIDQKFTLGFAGICGNSGSTSREKSRNHLIHHFALKNLLHA
jgi:hypothetical protein